MVNHSRRRRPLLPIIGLLLLLLLSSISATPSHQHHLEKEEEDSPITRFQGYLRINTVHPNPDYASAVSFLKSQALYIGLQTKTLEFARSKPLLLLTWPGSDPSLPSILLNSHLDSVPVEPSKWLHPPFSAYRSPDGKIFARGSQDDKCIAMQYSKQFGTSEPRTSNPLARFTFPTFPMRRLADEGQASTGDEFRVFYADRSPWNLIIKAFGMPGHGSRLYDNSAMENLMKSVEIITKFRESLFDVVKAGKAANSEVISVNPVYLKAGIPSPTGFVMNMQPSEAEAGFDLRMPPTADPDLVKIRIAEEWAPAIRNMTYQVTNDLYLYLNS
ncbi:Aminoacylase-1 [Vitis vinifera]|uniref:Aminoacylase-1 n=1 Tax=Vitis vinifera TaxID=29760 RepID=A0A438KMY0_VITVI|nr:Aminoacylase-1 [Vitis vinifera]